MDFIVSRLNAPPFSLGLSLVAFSDKGPHELLRLLSDVLARISPKQLLPRHGSHKAPEQTAERLATTLRIVKYQPGLDPVSFRQALAAGERDTIHAALKWVLSQGALLQKRAFVGFHLSLPDMPEELSYDPQAMELLEAIRELQGGFVATHKALDAAQQQVRELPQLRAEIKQLEGEKERLTDKVATAEAQAAALPDASSYQQVCVGLRQEHDREVAISQTLMAQQQQMERAEALHIRTAARLAEMQQALASQGGGGGVAEQVDGSRLLEVLRDDVARLRLQVSTAWPRELEAKQSRLAAVQGTLDNGINTEVDLQRLISQEGALRQHIAAAQERAAALERARAADASFLQVRQAQQVSALVSHKKAELAAKLQRLTERQAALTAALGAAAGGPGGGNGSVSDEEWRAKYEAVQARLPEYRRTKQALAELEAEACVLHRTLEILQQQDASGGGVPEGCDHADAAGLDAGNASNTGLPEQDGQDASALLEQLSTAIKQRKAQLAPAIAELRQLRQQQQDLEVLHAEGKAVYDAAVGGLEAAVAALEAEVAALRAELDADQQQLQAAMARAAELDAQLARIAAVGGDELRRRCQQELLDQEAALSQLRQERRCADDQAGGEAQAGMLQDLLQLLQLKQQLAASQAAAVAAATGGRGGGGGLLLSTGRWAAAAGGHVAAGGGFNSNVMVL